jgi:hypothetical protein
MKWRLEEAGTGRRRRCKQLLDDLKEKAGSSKLREKALHLILWRARCERAIVRQTTKWMNESNVYWTVHHCNSWRIKDQLDVTCHFISLSLNPSPLQNKTTDVIIQQHSRKLLMTDILMSETCCVHKKWNKIASDIKLVFHSSTMNEWMFTRFRSCALFQGNWLYSIFFRTVSFAAILKSFSHLYFGDHVNLCQYSIRFSRTTCMSSTWRSKLLLLLDRTEGNAIYY